MKQSILPLVWFVLFNLVMVILAYDGKQKHEARRLARAVAGAQVDAQALVRRAVARSHTDALYVAKFGHSPE
jgi:hypothetical protein